MWRVLCALHRIISQQRCRNVRLQALTLDEVCTSLSILDDVGIVKVEGKRDMLKRTVSTHPPHIHPPPT